MQRVFNLNLHYICNNACNNCISHNTRKSSKSILTLFHIEEMLLNYAPKRGDIVILSGGEPSIYPGLRALLELIRRYSDCEVVIYSNGYGVCSAGTADAIAEHADRITLSCYGYGGEHDRNAGRVGAFATLEAAADRLCRARKGLVHACALELKYVRAAESAPVLSLLNKLSRPEQVMSVVLSRMLPVGGNSARVEHDSATVRDIVALGGDERWNSVPLKLVDILPCSLSRNLFDEIRRDHPQRSVQEILFFDGTCPQGKLISFAPQPSFSSQCTICGLQAICGTTVTCYGALHRVQGHWCYAEE